MRHPFTRLLLGCLFLVLAACSNSDPTDPDAVGLIGRVSLGADAAVAGATVTVRDASSSALLAQTKTNRDGYYFAAGLRPAADVVITATGGAVRGAAIEATLRARRTADAHGAFAWVTPETTLVQALRSRSLAMSEDEARRRAHRVLGLPGDVPSLVRFDASRLHHHRSAFGHEPFLAAAKDAGGVDALLETLASQAVADRRTAGYPVAADLKRAASAAPPADGLATKGITLAGAASFIGTNLASGAVSAVGSLAMGWLMQAIGIPNPTTEALTALQQQVAANTALLQQISGQIAQLSSEISEVQTEIATLSQDMTLQFDQLSGQVAQGEYQATYDTASSYANIVIQWMDTLAGFMSQVQSASTSAELGAIAQSAYGWMTSLQSAVPGPQAIHADLVDLLTAQPGTRSLYRQFSDVVFGPGFSVMNASGSASLAALYDYWTRVLIHAEYIAIEQAHFAGNTLAAQTIVSDQNVYLNGTTRPTKLPAGVALQFGDYSNQGVFQGGVTGDLMWAAAVLPGITDGGPYAFGAAGAPWGTTGVFPGTVAGPAGTTLGGWALANGYDVIQLFALPAAQGRNLATFVPGLLGLSPDYTALLNGDGWWESSFGCANLTNFLPTTFSPYSSCTRPADGASLSSGYWFAYRVETNAAQYLPAN